MNTETYEQFSLPADAVQGIQFVKEGAVIDILFATQNEWVLKDTSNARARKTPSPRYAGNDGQCLADRANVHRLFGMRPVWFAARAATPPPSSRK